jgi:hypothetical protein
MPKRGLAGVLYGKEGMGKTSLGLQFPGPVRCFSIFENGYQYLEDVGAVPADSIDITITSFKELVQAIQKTTTGTLLFDGLKGIQKLIFDYVLEKYYEGDFAKFNAWSEGPNKYAPAVLQNLLDLCTQKNAEGVHTIFLGHMSTASVPNTLGADYLSHIILMHKECREVIRSWAGFVFMLNMSIQINIKTEVQGKGQNATTVEGKAEDQDSRWIYTTTSPAHEAKNRWNLPAKISMGKNPKAAFDNLWKYVPDSYK